MKMNILSQCLDVVVRVKTTIVGDALSPMPARSSKKRARADSELEASPAPQKRPRVVHKSSKPKLKPTKCQGKCSIDTAFAKFPRQTESLSLLYNDLRSRSWHHINDIPNEVKNLNNGELFYPVLIPADQCWIGGAENAPSADHIYSELKNAVKSSKDIIEYEGEQVKDKSVRDVLSQLKSPPDQCPLVAHNLTPKGDHEMTCKAIPFPSLYPDDEDDKDHAMNVTPRNKIVDIHIDQGSCGLSIGIGQPTDDPKLHVHKIWFLWPPTVYNLIIFEELCKTKRQKGLSLARSQALQHGVIASIGSEAGILLPPGWMHATVTTNSGFLIGITRTVPDTIEMISKIFAMDIRIDPDSFPHKAPFYIDALKKHAKVGGGPGSGARLWIATEAWHTEIEPALQTVNFRCNLKENAWRCEELLKVWKSCYNKDTERCFGEDWPCTVACGWEKQSPEDSFVEHWWKQHLKLVIPPGYKTPYTKRKHRKARG